MENRGTKGHVSWGLMWGYERGNIGPLAASQVQALPSALPVILVLLEATSPAYLLIRTARSRGCCANSPNPALHAP